MSNEQTEFAEFFRDSWEPCLRAVVAVVGRPQMAEDQVAEAFAWLDDPGQARTGVMSYRVTGPDAFRLTQFAHRCGCEIPPCWPPVT